MAGYLVSIAVLLAPEYVPWDLLWGGAVGGLIAFAPVLLLHSFVCLTGVRLPAQGAVLACLYAGGALVFALGFSDTLLYVYEKAPAGATTDVNGTIGIGPLYPVQIVAIGLPLVLALLVLAAARRARARAGRRSPRELDWMIAGTALLTLGALIMFGNAYAGSLAVESVLQLILIGGAAVVAAPLARYPGLVDGQLLKKDVRASLLGSFGVMAVFVVLVLLSGGSLRILLGVGWFVLGAFVFRDDVRALVDRVFYGASSRAERAGLRTAATYAGGALSLDVASLSPGQSGELVDYLSSLDRAGLAAARLEVADDARVELLAREEFRVVRDALGLPDDWSPEHGLGGGASGVVEGRLEPRERQALGLKYLGYSDKEMAQLMGVKPNVPRSYLSAAKRKLGLPAGAPMMLFVHFAGLVESDALPLVTAGPGDSEPAARPRPVATPVDADDPC
jgi:hypothetical protein